MIVSIWDDGYGISVPTKNQRAKADISEMLSGFQRKEGEKQGCEIIQVRAWDYPALLMLTLKQNILQEQKAFL